MSTYTRCEDCGRFVGDAPCPEHPEGQLCIPNAEAQRPEGYAAAPCSTGGNA
jgi:hypothetical protein